MKRLLFTFAFVLSVLNIQAADITAISNALKAGNTSSLTATMDPEADIAIPGYTKKGNNPETNSALSNFFKTNKPSAFVVVHHADKKDSGFFVGKLTTSDKTFRVNITYKAEGDKVIIQSIRIE
ncbi:MAG: DUF4783 domain-containing protein [Massilibacteroides sp.]|nr:DUF4783 domain-containing protein [Massilibacteroides sp.]MDD3063077.1 DUF4783 domain-containing protein [Massilibacteroides sp.]MDD4115425.1 DUF4783 domain-containing protein [Massilibacteroides sp.]MDD4660392.1 DUF4783 domain-containing protein [Massilibacteroides sp.]